MSAPKRFRMFAGPNGSGKSSLYERLRKDTIHTDVYIAADRIEADFRKKKRFTFNAYRIKVSETEFISFAVTSGILDKHPHKLALLKSLQIKAGILRLKNPAFIDSYLASCIASYLSLKLFETEQSFCFETVMSHPSKLEILKETKKRGFKTYLYFVFTEDPKLNIQRVASRVKAGGHDVAKEKITPRFQRSIRYLPDALIYADTTFIIDNSIDFEVVAEIEKGKKFHSLKKGYDFKKKLPDFYKKFKNKLK